MRVVVAGGCSSFARALFALLLEDRRVEEVIGIDRRGPVFSDARFAQVLLDLRSPQLARVVAGADVVINLAAAAGFDRPAGARERRCAFDAEGARNVFRAAAARRVPCVVHLSSAAVYALPAPRRPIGESHPRAPTAAPAWAEDLIRLEEWIDGFEPEHPGLRIVRLRPHLIVGRTGPWWVRRLLRGLVAARDPARAARPPRVQCVHAADVAAAIRNALRKDAAGAFNLACRNALPLHRIQWLARRGLVSLPYPIAYRLRAAAWGLGIGAEPAWTEHLRHELVLDTERARRVLGWKPRYDTVQACVEAPE